MRTNFVKVISGCAVTALLAIGCLIAGENMATTASYSGAESGVYCSGCQMKEYEVTACNSFNDTLAPCSSSCRGSIGCSGPGPGDCNMDWDSLVINLVWVFCALVFFCFNLFICIDLNTFCCLACCCTVYRRRGLGASIIQKTATRTTSITTTYESSNKTKDTLVTKSVTYELKLRYKTPSGQEATLVTSWFTSEPFCDFNNPPAGACDVLQVLCLRLPAAALYHPIRGSSFALGGVILGNIVLTISGYLSASFYWDDWTKLQTLYTALVVVACTCPFYLLMHRFIPPVGCTTMADSAPGSRTTNNADVELAVARSKAV